MTTPDKRSDLEKWFDNCFSDANPEFVTLRKGEFDSLITLIRILKRERDEARESIQLMADGSRRICIECGAPLQKPSCPKRQRKWKK